MVNNAKTTADLHWNVLIDFTWVVFRELSVCYRVKGYIVWKEIHK